MKQNSDIEAKVKKVAKICNESNSNLFLLPRQDAKNAWSARLKHTQKQEPHSRATSLLECKRHTGTNPLSTISGMHIFA